METIITAYSLTEDLNYTYLVGAIVFFVFAFALGVAAMDHLEHVIGGSATVVFFVAVVVCVIAPTIALGHLIQSKAEAETTHLASVIQTIEEEQGVVELHPVGEPTSHCTADSSYGTTMYTWKQADDDTALVRGTLEKSAEKDGSCTYRLYAGESLTTP